MVQHRGQFWYQSLTNDHRRKANQKSKLRTYQTFKNIFKVEPYPSTVSNREARVALTRLRISAHRLAIEQGRYYNIEENKRICTLCETGEVENEIHFLLQCKVYEEKRTPFLYFIKNTCKNIELLSISEKFIWLMSNEDPQICSKLAMYTNSSFFLRKTLIQNKE